MTGVQTCALPIFDFVIDKSLNNNEVDESLNKGELKIKNVQITVIEIGRASGRERV
nr:hypothetical protein [Staphylococcus haemolyticus]